MTRMVFLLLLTAGLEGCGSINHPLPKCDGYSRRPLNRSMWQWENNGKADQPGAEAVPDNARAQATSYAQDLTSGMPAAFAHFDVASSYRPCEAK